MYLIPRNVKVRFEIFRGFGWKELGITLLGLVIGGLLFLITGLLTGSIFRFLFIILGGTIAFFISMPHPRTGKNIIDFIRDSRNFKSKPRRYVYVRGEGRTKP